MPMATEQDFIQRIDRIDGVNGCLLLRDDGRLLGQTLTDSEKYVNLLVVAAQLSHDIKEHAGFSCCRYLCFHRADERHFYIFMIDRFLLGVLLDADCQIPNMVAAVLRLISRVSTVPREVSQREV